MDEHADERAEVGRLDAQRALDEHAWEMMPRARLHRVRERADDGRAAREGAARAEGRYCECCAIAFTGPEQLTEHVKGKKHRERARAAGQKPAG